MRRAGKHRALDECSRVRGTALDSPFPPGGLAAAGTHTGGDQDCGLSQLLWFILAACP